MGLMGFGGLFFLLLIGLLVWALARGFGPGPTSSGSPEEILKQRYARGEVDREEYERRLTDLRK